MNKLRSSALKWIFAVLMIYLSYGMFAKGMALGFHWHLPAAI